MSISKFLSFFQFPNLLFHLHKSNNKAITVKKPKIDWNSKTIFKSKRKGTTEELVSAKSEIIIFLSTETILYLLLVV
jgi:hypothetical protein